MENTGNCLTIIWATVNWNKIFYFYLNNGCYFLKKIEMATRGNSFSWLKVVRPGLQIRVGTGKLFSYFSTKTYVVGTQKNRLNETVLLSTQNTCLNGRLRKLSLSGPMQSLCRDRVSRRGNHSKQE